MKTFVAGVAKAVEWARTTPRDQVIARFQQILTKRARNEDNSQLQFWKSYGVNGKGGVIADTEFSTWIDWLKNDGQLTGKDIKATDIYTNDFNPYASGGGAA